MITLEAIESSVENMSMWLIGGIIYSNSYGINFGSKSFVSITIRYSSTPGLASSLIWTEGYSSTFSGMKSYQPANAFSIFLVRKTGVTSLFGDVSIMISLTLNFLSFIITMH